MWVGNRAGGVPLTARATKENPREGYLSRWMEPKPIVVRRQVWQGTQPKPAIVPKGGVESECHVLTWVLLALSCIWGQIVRCEVRRGGGRRVRDR